MLEGREISILKYSELNKAHLIFGSDFNSTKKLKALNAINSNYKLSDFFYLSNKIVPEFEGNAICYDLTHSIGNFLKEGERINKINSSKRIVEKNDFIISRLRSYLKEFAVVQKTKETQLVSSEYLVYKQLHNGLSPNTLLAFCLTNEVQTILNCSQYGTEHPRFFEFVFTELPIPKSVIAINKNVDDVLSKAYLFIEKGKKAFNLAENFLLESLGIKEFKFSKEIANIKNFKESFISSGRLDAEFYQKKFDELEDIIQKTKQGIRLGSILKLNKRGTQPVYTESDNGVPVLNSKHIRENRIDFFDNRYGNSNFSNPELIIQKYDVLINGTGVGTIGRCATYLRDIPSLPDNHVTILRTTDIDPIYLSVFLNSLAGKMQVEKFFKGSSGQIELYPTDIDQFWVWNAPKKIQYSIRKKIEEAENFNIQADKLLQLARQAVEIAIHQNEKEAIKFISKNI